LLISSNLPDGLSIPFFTVGRKIHSSTLSLPLKRDVTQWFASAAITPTPGGAVAQVDFVEAPPRISVDERADDVEFGEQVSRATASSSITVEFRKEEDGV
jgi:hypothetical protein